MEIGKSLKIRFYYFIVVILHSFRLMEVEQRKSKININEIHLISRCDEGKNHAIKFKWKVEKSLRKARDYCWCCCWDFESLSLVSLLLLMVRISFERSHGKQRDQNSIWKNFPWNFLAVTSNYTKQFFMTWVVSEEWCEKLRCDIACHCPA